MCGGTLEHYYNGKYHRPRFQNDKEIVRQTTQALVHLHNKRIVHRDIKPSNILIFFSENSKGIECKLLIKLADFDISKLLKSESKDATKSDKTNPSGTRGWIAPELFKLERFDFKVDIWALGCVFGFTMSEGHKHPFGDDQDLRVSRIMKKEPMLMKKNDLKRPYSEDDVVYNLIESMVDMDPSKRPTAEQVAEHPFLKLTQVRNRFYSSICYPNHILV